MADKILAWHFIKPSKRLRYEPFTDIRVGEVLSCDPDKLTLCRYGLHASVKPLDALSFVDWEGAIICRVELSGKILHGNDKIVAEHRRVLWWTEADPILNEFACSCAEDVLPIWTKYHPTDERPAMAIDAKRRFIIGDIDQQQLAAARAAASYAAWDAASYAAWDAARAAARAAASSAASYAAMAAARAAARDAAMDAARDAQNEIIENMLFDAMIYDGFEDPSWTEHQDGGEG